MTSENPHRKCLPCLTGKCCGMDACCCGRHDGWEGGYAAAMAIALPWLMKMRSTLGAMEWWDEYTALDDIIENRRLKKEPSDG